MKEDLSLVKCVMTVYSEISQIVMKIDPDLHSVQP